MNNLSIIKYKIESNYDNNTFFDIFDNNWKNSFDIDFNTSISDLHIVNLFLILKSYTYNSNIIIKHVFFYYKNIENRYNIKMIKQIDINILYKINFIDFTSLIYNINLYEELYSDVININGLRIITFDMKNMLYPIYPWKKNWYKFNGM